MPVKNDFMPSIAADAVSLMFSHNVIQKLRNASDLFHKTTNAATNPAIAAIISPTGFIDIMRFNAAELYTAGLPEVDFLLRTSGETRLSNFLLYQLAYAEFYQTDVLWPDFDRHAYDEALLAYTRRNRRFGGV